MKKQYKLIAALSAVFIIASCFPVFSVKAEALLEEDTAVLDEETAALDEEAAVLNEETAALDEESTALDEETAAQDEETTVLDDSLQTDESSGSENLATTSEENSSPSDPDEMSLQELPLTAEELSDMSVPDEPPAFSAKIEYNSQGYVVMGTFTEFLPDTSLIQPVYSLDGEAYQACGPEWYLLWIGSEDEDADVVSKWQNQICLYPSNEPLKSYLAGTLDRFYLKLRITRKNGITYDTQAAVIERSDISQPVPEEASLHAKFAPSMIARKFHPFGTYGKYQLTISADASPEDIAELLPATLPVEVQIERPQLNIMIGIVDCPVTWKPLSLPSLTAGESVTINDAAEEIIVPEGTLVNTPTGTFELHEPLSLNQDASTDEVSLILNVVSKNEAPTGGLIANNTGLEMFFDLKPTGASSIQTYVLSEGAAEWTQLSPPLSPSAINSHFSNAGGNYALVLRNDQEPYQSYLAAKNAGETVTPFLIGLKIEGGVYDNCQLILPWPNTYESPQRPPDLVGGMGGNENNAGANNKNDSNAEGQRPDLPKNPRENLEPITVSDTLSEIELSYENQQNLSKALVPDKAAASAPPVFETQKATDRNAEKASPTSAPSPSLETGTQPEVAAAAAETLSPVQNPSAAPVLSNEKEKTDSDSGISHHKAFLPLIWAAAAVIIGIAVIGKLAVNKISGKFDK